MTNRHDPFQIVRDFESAVADYTQARYCVAVSSCTMALLLAVAWHLRVRPAVGVDIFTPGYTAWFTPPREVEIPRRTYVSVPMSIMHAGGRPTFRHEDWHGQYRLQPLPVWDAARRFTQGMYGFGRFEHERGGPGGMICVSFHWSKILGIQQGGAILHDDPVADAWLRRARFDGRAEGVAPKHDTFTFAGWHAIMSPEIAAEGLVRLQFLPYHNPDLPNDDYPDLSQMECFR